MGLKLPAEIEKEPEISVEEWWWFDCYEQLHFDRTIGMTPGPIPSWAIRRLAADERLTRNEAEDMEFIVRRLDEAYLDHCEKKMKSQQQQNSKPKGK